METVDSTSWKLTPHFLVDTRVKGKSARKQKGNLTLRNRNTQGSWKETTKYKGFPVSLCIGGNMETYFLP